MDIGLTKRNIEEAFVGTLTALGIASPRVLLEHPDDPAFGDYTTNVALMYSKDLKEKPFVLAQKVAEALREKNIPHVDKIDIAGPGFINISLDRTFFSEGVKAILSAGTHFGDTEAKKGQKVIIEYTNTNVLKPLHIGHLMGNIIGESLSRVYERSGAELKRNTYQGDVGLHIAKALWGMKALADKKPKKGTLRENTAFIGEAYAYGASAYEDDEKAAEEIKVINKAVFEKSDKELNALYAWGRETSLAHFEELYKKLGTKFDYYFFESEVADDALKIVREFVSKGIFEESDGAIVFKGEKYDPKLHTRVFVNSQGLPTYEAKDIAHALRKYKTWAFDHAIIITANEQNDYFSVVLRALKEVDPDIAARTAHLSHGMLRLSTGKMSSRTGNVITGESLIDDVEDLVKEKIKDRGFAEEEGDKVAETVGIAAIKYSILKQSPGSDIIFDFDKSVSFEGDSGPYLQYTSVRAASVIKKAGEERIAPKVGVVPTEITLLERLVYRLPEVVERSAIENAPHYLTTYLAQVAGAFNSWYGTTKIADAQDPYSPWKLALAAAAKTVIDNGLFLLGMKVPEKM